MANSLRQDLHSYSEISIHINIQKQSMGSPLKMLTKSLKTVFHFQPLWKSLPPSKSLALSQVEQLPKLSSPLDPSKIALMCIFPSILKHLGK